jgi:hypothetical protein
VNHPADPAPSTEPSIPSAASEAWEPHVWEGDDDHVIFWMLSLTPTERVEVAQDFIDGVLMLRNGPRP